MDKTILKYKLAIGNGDIVRFQSLQTKSATCGLHSASNVSFCRDVTLQKTVIIYAEDKHITYHFVDTLHYRRQS